MRRARSRAGDLCVGCAKATGTHYSPSLRGWLCKSCEDEIAGEAAVLGDLEDDGTPAWLIEELRPQREAGE